ncbi:MAG TPA: aspartate-semialdehyde dehydrogenase [Verrucomicrobiae bacterium]|nr:aspartate-semialdehyde dehydrogenase [Verrucomicrobiae bacterium]
MRKRRVAVVGATGVAGQQFLAALAGHPWFEVAVLAASARSAGRPYGEAIREASGARRWWVTGMEPAPEFLALPVVDAARLDPDGLDLVFAAVESDAARELEPMYARAVPVISTAAAFRSETDTPIALPGVNVAAHLPLLAEQRRRRGWKGFVLPLPNCTTVGLAISLKPLLDRFGLARVLMTSLQGISGAGRSPGVVALDIVDNVIPFIPKEEEKVAAETRKILGRLGEGGIELHPAPVGATCTRVGVLEGHTLSVMVETERPCDPAAAAEAMRAFRGDYEGLGLPSAPAHPILVHEDPFRPQPRLDRDAEGGMATSVGRLRTEPALRNGLKYVALSHNTRMGAAHGAVLAAEHLCHAGVL